MLAMETDDHRPPWRVSKKSDFSFCMFHGTSALLSGRSASAHPQPAQQAAARCAGSSRLWTQYILPILVVQYSFVHFQPPRKA
jgi:hypothetical protein